MPEEDEFIKELESLREASKSALNVDSTIDFNTNIEKRRNFVIRLDLINNRLKSEYALKTQFLSYGKPYVRSFLQVIKKPKEFTQEIDLDAETRFNFYISLNGRDGLYQLDNIVNRTLTYKEFAERFEKLYNLVNMGQLEDILSMEPAIVIHSIMGLSGELLNRLEIDPKKGETYNMLNDIINYKLSKKLRTPNNKPFLNTINEIIKSIDFKTNEKKVIDTIKLTPKVQSIRSTKIVRGRPYIGFEGISMTPEIAKIRKLDENTKGILVRRVYSDSIAEKAGLQQGNNFIKFQELEIPLDGDVITEINGLKITKKEELYEYYDRYYELSSGITFRILRKGQLLDLKMI
jgi:hypothetical protein